MQVAKQGCNGQILFPDGCTDILSVPHDLHTAIEQAYRVLSWQENLTDEEMPPRWMWHLDWELEAHFTTVKRKRDERFGINSSSEDSSSENEDLWEDNSLASRFKK